MDKQDIILYHSGIKGMKWGVRNQETLRKYGLLRGIGRRKSENQNGGEKIRTASPNKAVRERKKERKQADKYRSLISEKELDKKIRRLEKEKRLRELTENELNAGKKTTNSLMSQYGKQIAGVVVAAVATELAAQVVSGAKIKRGLREQQLRNDLTSTPNVITQRQSRAQERVRSAIGNVVTGNGIRPIQPSTRAPQDTRAYKVGKAIARVRDFGLDTRATYRAGKGKHVRY